MAPVIAALRRNALFAVTLATGQHRRDARPGADLLGLRPDLDLQLMRRDQTLSGLAAATLAAMDEVLAAVSPTAAGPGGHHHRHGRRPRRLPSRRRVGHVEAGLRTGDLARPFPEEANRRIVDTVAAALSPPAGRPRPARRGV